MLEYSLILFIDVGSLLKVQSSVSELKLTIIHIRPPMTSVTVEVTSEPTSQTSETSKTAAIATAQTEKVTQVDESEVENSDVVQNLYVAITTKT